MRDLNKKMLRKHSSYVNAGMLVFDIKKMKENNLEVVETIFPISARLIANKSGFKFKTKEIEELTEKVKKLIDEREKK